MVEVDIKSSDLNRFIFKFIFGKKKLTLYICIKLYQASSEPGLVKKG